MTISVVCSGGFSGVLSGVSGLGGGAGVLGGGAELPPADAGPLACPERLEMNIEGIVVSDSQETQIVLLGTPLPSS